MSTNSIATIIKMMESLPLSVQDKVVEHLQEYLLDLQDELKWDYLFQNTQNQLVAKAKLAKQEIAKGQSKPMEYDKL